MTRHRFAFKMLCLPGPSHSHPRIAITALNKWGECVGYDIDNGDFVKMGIAPKYSAKTYNRHGRQTYRWENGRSVKTGEVPMWYGTSSGGMSFPEQEVAERFFEPFIEELPLDEMYTSPIPHIRKLAQIARRRLVPA